MPSRINNSSPHPNPSPNTPITPNRPTTIDRPNCDPPKQETPTPNPGHSPRPPQQGPSIATPSTYEAVRLLSSGNRHPPAQAITTSPSSLIRTSNTAPLSIAPNNPTLPADTSTHSDFLPGLKPRPAPASANPETTEDPSTPIQLEDTSTKKAPALSAISNVILRGLETGERSPHASIGLFIDLITVLAHGQELTEGHPFPELQAQIQNLKELQSHWSESSDQQT
jgi:hypothetical protein